MTDNPMLSGCVIPTLGRVLPAVDTLHLLDPDQPPHTAHPGHEESLAVVIGPPDSEGLTDDARLHRVTRFRGDGRQRSLEFSSAVTGHRATY
jgi:hypothetical protein